jgi:hypothetical protein
MSLGNANCSKPRVIDAWFSNFDPYLALSLLF